MKQLFVALADAMPQLTWLSAEHGQWTWSSSRWTAHTGLTLDESRDLGWYAAVHPDDRVATATAWENATNGAKLDIEHRLISVANPEECARWFHTRAALVNDGRRRQRRWLGICTEVHERRIARGGLAAQKRATRSSVCEALALSRRIARRTIETVHIKDDHVGYIEDQLDAVARVQLMAARGTDASVSIQDLILEELLAHAVQDSDQVETCGTNLPLPVSIAEVLVLGIRGLLMGALEFGALSSPRGHLLLRWCVEGDEFHFRWTETWVPVQLTARHRFEAGWELFERTLQEELGATTSLTLLPGQVRYDVIFPVTPSFRECIKSQGGFQ